MDTPVRLAIIGSRGIPARYGGFETFAEQLSVRLTEQGVDVTVFCESQNTAPLPDYRGVRRQGIRPFLPGPAGAVLYDVISLVKCIGRYDVIYMLGFGTGLFCEILRRAGTVVWVNMDGAEGRRASWGLLARGWFRIMKDATARGGCLLIADSAKIRELLCAEYSPPPDCRVIAYGAETVTADPGSERLRHFGVAPDGYYLMVSRLVPENNLLDLVTSFKYAPTEKKLLLIGDFRRNSSYARRLRSLAGGRVIMTGPVYDDKIMKSLRFHSYGYFHGHSVGGTNPSLLEAMGCGCAVVAMDNPFNRETAGDSVLYIRSAAGLPAAVERLERSNGLRRQLGNRARTRIAERFHWDGVAASYVTLLRESLKGKEALRRSLPAESF